MNEPTIKQKMKDKKVKKMSEALSKNELTPEQSQRILNHLDNVEQMKQKSNRDLAELLVDSDTYGKLSIGSEDCLLLDEIMMRLLDGRIPASWGEETEREEPIDQELFETMYIPEVEAFCGVKWDELTEDQQFVFTQLYTS